MGILLGIDIGGSTTKLIGLTEAGGPFGALQIRASRPEASAYGALGSFSAAQGVSLSQIDRIALTGVGASFLRDELHGIPAVHVPEFEAVGQGALALSGLNAALAVSMGTGTAFVRASHAEGCAHIGGSGVGGGTITGLCGRLTCARHFDTITELASQGTLRNVDLMVEDIFQGSISSLPADLTAANFGNYSDHATEGDTALGVLNMVFQTIGMLSVFACRNDSLRDAVLVGALTEIPQTAGIFQHFTELFGVRFVIPPNAPYATALGAALHLRGRAPD